MSFEVAHYYGEILSGCVVPIGNRLYVVDLLNLDGTHTVLHNKQEARLYCTSKENKLAPRK